ELSAASKNGQLRDALARYIKPHVLVVDEVGYLPYGDDAASVLYHVVNDRHIRHRAMVFTTNKHPKRWGAVLHDDDLAEAIVDRILERGRLLRLDGPSLRTKHLAADELADSGYTQPEPARVSGTTSAEFPERTAPPATPRAPPATPCASPRAPSARPRLPSASPAASSTRPRARSARPRLPSASPPVPSARPRLPSASPP